IPVQVGVTSGGNIKLEVGQESQTVEVSGTAVQINTEQPAVQGVLTSQQIEKLPMNGRNFLDLAQLEPGVQIQDGGNFDPTKNGFSSISFGGRYGRSARISLDGIDVSDETVGTTTQNISAGAIDEFQISQSSLDLSTELTSSGAVNVVTKSGTNGYHGEGFYLFRDKRAGMANFPGGQDLPFQRNHFGGSFGGPILKDKLFFFINGERNKQAGFFPLTFPAPLNVLNGGFSAPYTETEAFGRLDYTLKRSARLFYKFTYDNNNNVNNFRPDYQAFVNRDNVPSQAVGVDFNTGEFTHSVRFGYLKFVNHIADAASTAPVDPLPGINLQVRPFRSGPNSLAPQAT